MRTSHPAERGVPPCHPTCYLHPPRSRGGGGNSRADLPHRPSPCAEGAAAGWSSAPFSCVEGGNMRAAWRLQLHPSLFLPAFATPGVEGGSSRLKGTTMHHLPGFPSPTRSPRGLALSETGRGLVLPFSALQVSTETTFSHYKRNALLPDIMPVAVCHTEPGDMKSRSSVAYLLQPWPLPPPW